MTSRLIAVAAMAVFLAVGLGGAASTLAQDATAPTISVVIDGDYGPHLPPAVYDTDYAKKGDSLINLLHVFMLVLFVGWGVFFVYCLVKFRARPDRRASPTLVKAKIAKYVEVGVAIFEAVLLIGLALPVWAEVKVDFPTDEDNPVRVRVVAEQFMWNFQYPGPDGEFGKIAPEYIDPADNPLGIDPNDPKGLDDLYASELHFPVQRPVIAELTSKDVIHSFSIPVLRVKQDVIPGMRIPVWFRAKETGNYEIACSQLCGNNHYSMRALMTIHDSEDAFEQWLLEQVPEEFDEDDLD